VPLPLSLDPALLSALRDLELVARLIVDGTLSGLHASPFHGYSAEFSEYRHYRAGDDLKYVDWKLFARTDRFYTRQYRETSNLGVQIVVDASRSMGFGGRAGVTKLQYARLLAAALAHLTAGQGDAIGLVVYDVAIRDYVPGRVGRLHLRTLLTKLSRMEASGGTSTATALRRGFDLLNRRGLLILISDLYEEDEAVERELRRAARSGHDVAVFHVLTREELEFPFTRDVELQDLESGGTALAGPGSAGSYRRDVAEFVERWRARCARDRIDYTRIMTDAPLDAALRSYLLRRAGSPAR
jgi:uncharacterized protein (DUF58 family)